MCADWWENYTPTPEGINYTPIGSQPEEQGVHVPSVITFPDTTPTFPNTGYQAASNEGIVLWDTPGGRYVPVDFQNLDWTSISNIPATGGVSQTVAAAIAPPLPAGNGGVVNSGNLDAYAVKIGDFKGKAATTGDLFGSFSFLGLTGITAFLVFWMLMQKK